MGKTWCGGCSFPAPAQRRRRASQRTFGSGDRLLRFRGAGAGLGPARGAGRQHGPVHQGRVVGICHHERARPPAESVRDSAAGSSGCRRARRWRVLVSTGTQRADGSRSDGAACSAPLRPVVADPWTQDHPHLIPGRVGAARGRAEGDRAVHGQGTGQPRWAQHPDLSPGAGPCAVAGGRRNSRALVCRPRPQRRLPVQRSLPVTPRRSGFTWTAGRRLARRCGSKDISARRGAAGVDFASGRSCSR